jgi:hypothetical protein
MILNLSQIRELVFVLRLQLSISSENDTADFFSPLLSLSLRRKPRIWRYALLVELPLLQREGIMPEVTFIDRNDDGVFN